MSDYPEHEKMAAVRDQSQAIGAFLDAENGYVLCEFVPCSDWHMGHDEGDCRTGPHLAPVQKSINVILAEHFDIDLDKIEEEKRAMLDLLRSTAEERSA